MIDNKIEELFKEVKSSKEYQNYKNIESILQKDKSINKLINEIKKLQQKSVNLEYHHDEKYKDIDKLIAEKVELLNSKPVYQEYLSKMQELNNILSMSSNMIENYLQDKIN